MELKDIVSAYRRQSKLTMQELADKCGLSKGYISMLESGKHPNNERKLVPSLDTYKKLASGMGLNLDDLLRMVDEDTVVSLEKPEIDLQFFADRPNEADMRLIHWFRSLPPEKQKAILIAQDAPEDLL